MRAFGLLGAGCNSPCLKPGIDDDPSHDHRLKACRDAARLNTWVCKSRARAFIQRSTFRMLPRWILRIHIGVIARRGLEHECGRVGRAPVGEIWRKREKPAATCSGRSRAPTRSRPNVFGAGACTPAFQGAVGARVRFRVRRVLGRLSRSN